MDNNKKQQNFSRSGNTKTSNSTTDSTRQKSSDLQSNKYWPKSSRRRENPQTSARSNNSNSKQQQQTSVKVRPNVDKRPRARGNYGGNGPIQNSGSYHDPLNDNAAASSGLGSGESTIYAFSGEGAVGRYDSNHEYELNSVYSPGTKKQSLNHLLNFYYTPREVDYYDGVGGGNPNGAQGQRQSHLKKHKYNKEQFLQANFQFVIKASAKRKTDDSPDTLIDWSLIEQINIQTLEEPQCPICLFPPVAAKVTRCGHVYCWPCVLHYLSLSDKTWRKCPICYDALHVSDLKSASIVQQQGFNVGSDITFRLMRRKKGSLFIEKFETWNSDDGYIVKYPYVSSPLEEKLFSKFILATRGDVADILERERGELLKDVDESCPEFVFIQQALELLKERFDKLGDHEIKESDNTMLTKDLQVQCGLVVPIDINFEDNNLKLNEHNEDNDVENEYCQIDKVSAVVSQTQHISNFADVTSIHNTKFYYFYQVEDGQNIFLHPLNVKMLQACYGGLTDAPPVITARILQKEQHSMDEEHRRKFTCLAHLPLTCQFSVVEVELQPPYVRDDIIQMFKADIIHRKKERQRRAREEREREKHIDAINDRQMGKLIASTANINISSSHEFPTCGFEDTLGTSNAMDNIPSTSKGSRKKTTSTSSAGSCSYSSIASNCQQENSPWTTFNATQLQKLPKAVEQPGLVDVQVSILDSIQTNLGDVLAQALSQKNIKKGERSSTESVKANSNNNKKSKRSKKLLPLYSTGMNFNGN